MDNKGCIDESLCRHEIRLEDGNGKLITSFPLSEYLKENAKYIDVTKQEAYLPISIKFTPVGVTIENGLRGISKTLRRIGLNIEKSKRRIL